MKMNKNRTEKKDWQRADARVLGQILAAQNIEFILPDSAHIADFFAETLITIPGIKACRVCLGDVSIRRGDMEGEICAECQASRKRTNEREDHPSLGFDFRCELSAHPGIQVNVINSIHHHFGFFVFKINDSNVFNVYKPFIGNLANYVAISLENRLQRDLLQMAHDELERKVQERTQSLVETNTHLQEEIEIRRRIEEALRASEQQIKQLIDASPIAMIVSSGIDEHVESVNNKFVELFGYTIEDIPDATHWWPLAYPDQQYRDEIKTQWQAKVEKATKDEGQTEPMDATVTCKDGSRRYVEFRYSSIGRQHLVTFVDLTERKRAEQKATQLAAIVESSDDAIIGKTLNGIITSWNMGAERIYGYTENEMIGQSISVLVPTKREDELSMILEKIKRGEHIEHYETIRQRKDGQYIDMSLTISPIRDVEGKIIGASTIGHDITERKKAEQGLRESEERFAAAFHASPNLIAITRMADGTLLEVNEGYTRLLGYSRAESIGKTTAELSIWTNAADRATFIDNLNNFGQITDFETTLRRKDGSVVTVSDSARTIKLQGETCILSVIHDITDRKKTEEALRKSEQEFRSLAENSPDVIVRYDREGRRIYVNPEFERVNHLSAQDVQGKTPVELSTELAPMADVFTEKLMAVMESGIIDEIDLSWLKHGKPICWFVRLVPEFDTDGKVVSALTIWSDITERKQAEDALRKSEMGLKEAQRVGRLGSWDWDALTDTITWSEEYYHIYGFDPTQSPPGYEEHLKAYTPESAARLDAAVKKSMESGAPYEIDLELAHNDGPQRWITARCEIKRDTNGQIVGLRGTAQDITERKQHENEREVIVQISNALRSANTRAEMLPILLDQVNDMFHTDGAAVTMSQPITGELLIELGRGKLGEKFSGLTLSSGEGVSGRVIDSGKPYLCNDIKADSIFAYPELLGGINAIACAPLIAHELTIGALWIIRANDITEGELRLLVGIADIAANAIQRVTLFEQTQRQLQHLMALHQIDITISASLDLAVTLNIFLNTVITQLNVDAADILLVSPHSQVFKYSAGIGFWTRNIEQTRIQMGEGQAGMAALQRHIVSLPDLKLAPETFSRSNLLAEEKFISHSVAPLVAKGQIKGILETFTRKRLDATREWLDFFETLATQAAIAIDNANLFNNLQQSNIELRLAYDATIEGWSRALDMRDRETEGHSQRVTEMALQLAEKIGMSDMEKLDLRRGALLHDIGKMGIPDSILLKPGQLTEAEWKIMRLHPVHAFEMLEPISYLREALDIPYCHHEKWDGTGYPRGLTGKQIPLSARIFAIADVFDALTSTRPYRAARSKEDAYQYIREQAGKHFDPDIVNAFLEMQQVL